MKRIIRTIAILLALACLLPITLCSCGSTKDGNKIEETETVLTVGGHEVSYGLYRYFFLNYKLTYTEKQLSEDPDKVYAEIKDYVYDALCGMYAVIAMCADHGVGVTDADILSKVEATKDSIKEQYVSATDKTGEKGFKEEMKANFMTESVFDLIFAVDFCEEKLYVKMTEEGGAIPSDDTTVRRALDEEFIRVLQVYINIEDTDKSYDECKTLAHSVAEKAKAGADFNELVAENSNDYSMTRDGYYMPRGYMSEEFEAVAFALEEDEVSDVLELDDGFHIIKRVAMDDTYVEKNYETLKERYLTCRLHEKIDERQTLIKVSETELFSEIAPAKIAFPK